MKKINALGVDLGNGFIKIVYDNQTHVEPAVFSYAPPVVFSHGQDQSFEVNGESLLLGEDAVESGLVINKAVGETDSLNRYNSQEYENLLFGFIAKFFKKDVEISNLTLGLPNNHFVKTSKELTQKFKNDEKTVVYNGEEIKIKIVDVHVLPQPFGVYLRDDNANKNIMVVDLGEGTNDYTHINKNGNINHMFSTDDGLKKFYIETLRYLEQKYPNMYLELSKVPMYLRDNGVKDVNGEFVPVIDNHITQLKQKYSRTILQPVIDQFDHMNQFDAIIFTGGGAYAFEDTLNDFKSELPNIVIAEDPQFANAQGFYNYANAFSQAVEESKTDKK